MANYPEAPLAWADDDAIPIGLHHGTLAQDLPQALLVAPDPEIGLTLDDAQRIAAHLGNRG